MAIYNVSVRATYYDDLEIEADDKDDAYRKAIKQFNPESDNLFAIDVYGLSPWEPENGDEDYHYETSRQAELDNQ